MRLRWACSFLAFTGLAQAQTPPEVAAPPQIGVTIMPPMASGVAALPTGYTSAIDAPDMPGSCAAAAAPQMGGRLWFDADYLVWYVKKQNVPPLIRLLPTSQFQNAQVDPNVGTPTVFPPGGKPVNFHAIEGARLRVGAWFDSSRTFGVEASGNELEQKTKNVGYRSSPADAYGPSQYYFNPSQQRGVFLFDNPATTDARYSGYDNQRPTYNLELSLVREGYSMISDRVDYLFGPRYLDYRENVSVISDSRFVGTPFSATTEDHFSASNKIYALQFGLRSKIANATGLSAEATLKTAFGFNSQQVNINGANSFINAGVADTEGFGLYARPSNSGKHTRDIFVFMPEMDLRLSYALSSRAKFTFGYDVLYISSVMRPGQAIDLNVSDSTIRFVNQANNPANTVTNRPQFTFDSTSLWMQGLSFGLSLDY